MTYLGANGAPILDREPVHIRHTQHWTRCRRKVERVDRTVHDRTVARLALEARGEPAGICPICYTRWRGGKERRR